MGRDYDRDVLDGKVSGATVEEQVVAYREQRTLGIKSARQVETAQNRPFGCGSANEYWRILADKFPESAVAPSCSLDGSPKARVDESRLHVPPLSWPDWLLEELTEGGDSFASPKARVDESRLHVPPLFWALIDFVSRRNPIHIRGRSPDEGFLSRIAQLSWEHQPAEESAEPSEESDEDEEGDDVFALLKKLA